MALFFVTPDPDLVLRPGPFNAPFAAQADPDLVLRPGPFGVPSFCVGVENVRQDPPAVTPSTTPTPLTDTYRGGSFVVTTRPTATLDVSRDELFDDPSLMGWTTSGSVDFTRAGAVLTSVTADATAQSPNSDYVYFDAAIDVEPLLPPDTSSAPAYVACLEHPVGGVVVRVCLVRGAFAASDQLVALGEAFAGDPAAGAAAAPSDSAVTLRLVRNGSRVYGFVGTRAGTADGYTLLTKVLDVNIPALGTSTGPLVLSSRFGGNRTTQARFRNLTLRSHFSVNGRLLNNKVDQPGRQITGNVPAATISEVGSATTAVFGLFGVNTDTSSFTYTLPSRRTVGNEIVRTLRTYQDPVVRD